MKRNPIILTLTIAAAILGSFFSVHPAALSGQTPAMLRAQQIVLVDASGRARIVLGTDPTGTAAIRVLDPGSGKPRIVLAVPADGSSTVELHDAGGNRRADLSLTSDGVRLSLADPALKGGIVLGSGADKKTVLVFNDSQGVYRATLGLTADQDPNLALYDTHGSPIWTAVAVTHS